MHSADSDNGGEFIRKISHKRLAAEPQQREAQRHKGKKVKPFFAFVASKNLGQRTGCTSK
jgi:hypothetical protein